MTDEKHDVISLCQTAIAVCAVPQMCTWWGVCTVHLLYSAHPNGRYTYTILGSKKTRQTVVFTECNQMRRIIFQIFVLHCARLARITFGKWIRFVKRPELVFMKSRTYPAHLRKLCEDDSLTRLLLSEYLFVSVLYSGGPDGWRKCAESGVGSHCNRLHSPQLFLMAFITPETLITIILTVLGTKYFFN